VLKFFHEVQCLNVSLILYFTEPLNLLYLGIFKGIDLHQLLPLMFYQTLCMYISTEHVTGIGINFNRGFWISNFSPLDST
jgi:hypothetical protein